MRKFDTKELGILQIELWVAKQIMEEYKVFKSKDIYIKQEPLANIPDTTNTGIGYLKQMEALESLQNKGLIKTTNEEETLKSGILIHINDSAIFKAFYRDLFELVPLNSENVRIVYCPSKGTGKLNGEEFKLNSRSINRRIFGYLAKYPNERISKQRLWNVAKKNGNFRDDSSNNIEFNNTIRNLRKALNRIDSQYLSIKKEVILRAEVTLIT